MTFVKQGSSLELQCVVEGGDVDTTYPVAWYYNNVPLDTGTGDGTLVLDMENSGIEQGGWYTCAVSSNDRREVLDFLVIVGGKTHSVHACDSILYSPTHAFTSSHWPLILSLQGLVSGYIHVQV